MKCSEFPLRLRVMIVGGKQKPIINNNNNNNNNNNSNNNNNNNNNNITATQIVSNPIKSKWSSGVVKQKND